MTAFQSLPEPLQILVQEWQAVVQRLSGLKIPAAPDSNSLRGPDLIAARTLAQKQMAALEPWVKSFEQWCNGALNAAVTNPNISPSRMRRTAARLSGFVDELKALSLSARQRRKGPAVYFAAVMLDRVLLHVMLQIRDFAENVVNALTSPALFENGNSVELNFSIKFYLGFPARELIDWLESTAAAAASLAAEAASRRRDNARRATEVIVTLIVLAITGVLLWNFGIIITVVIIGLLGGIILLFRYPIIALVILLLTGLGG